MQRLRFRQVVEIIRAELEMEADKPQITKVHSPEAQETDRNTHKTAMRKIND